MELPLAEDTTFLRERVGLPARPPAHRTLPDPAGPCRTPPAAQRTLSLAVPQALSGATWVPAAGEGQPLPPASEVLQGLATASSCPDGRLSQGDATPGPCPHSLRTCPASSRDARWALGWLWSKGTVGRGTGWCCLCAQGAAGPGTQPGCVKGSSPPWPRVGECEPPATSGTCKEDANTPATLPGLWSSLSRRGDHQS